MLLHRLLLAIAGLVVAVIVFFFAWGVSDGTVGADNILLWLAILAVPGGVLWGAARLRASRQMAAANALLLILALPGAAIGLFILFALVMQPRWN
ncbi:MAG TPA: osmoprotectant transporter permease [Allosphingosinicella sp.]|nr:osmoprotectant transporter permease [Allosphingosinicella sp.]